MSAARAICGRFWQGIADSLARGETLATALQATVPLSPQLQGVLEAVKSGKTMTEGMAMAGDLFTPAMCAMMRGGELGGVMDLAAKEISEALGDGSLRWEGNGGDAAVGAMLCLLGHLLGSGVPILSAIDLAGAEVDAAAAHELGQAMHEAVLQRRSTACALAGRFPVQAEAIEKAETSGELDRVAIQLGRDLMSSKSGDVVTSGEAAKLEQAVEELLLGGLRDRASDLHLEPGGIRVRIDGVLHARPVPGGVPAEAIIGRLMAMSGMDREKRGFPQDGQIRMKLNNQGVDLRVSAVPTVDGDRMTVRILTFENLSFDLRQVVGDPAKLALIGRLLSAPHGVIICSGPTGSGKTTLMYSMLMQLDRQAMAVMSVEDPVEVRLPGVSQVQVNMAAGLTFARVIRSFLRQDPDVIMLGEIRDFECAGLACQAAITGHLVISTMHTDSAPAAIGRLVDVGIEPFLVSASVAGVIAQRLVRQLCPHCRKAVEVAPDSLPAEVREVLAGIKPTFYAPGGCEQCGGTGFRGRLAIHEILVVSEGLRDAISRRASSAEVAQIARGAGMRTMRQDGALLAAQGRTTLEEVFRVAPAAG